MAAEVQDTRRSSSLGDDAEREVARKDAEKNALLDRILYLEAQIGRIGSAAPENAPSRAQTAAAQQPENTKKSSPQIGNVPDEACSRRTSPSFKRDKVISCDEYAHLAGKYNRVQRERDHYRQAYHVIKDKMQKIKQGWRAWKEHVDRNMRPKETEHGDGCAPQAITTPIPTYLQELAEAHTRRSSPSLSSYTPRASHSDEQSRSLPRATTSNPPPDNAGPEMSMYATGDPSISEKDAPVVISYANAEPSRANPGTDQQQGDCVHYDSTQATEGEAEELPFQVELDPLPSSDSIPEVVFARPVKRKRHRSDGRSAAAPRTDKYPSSKTPRRSTQVKAEELSSQPERDIPITTHRVDTLDLDEPGKMNTPRKRRRVDDLYWTPNKNNANPSHHASSTSRDGEGAKLGSPDKCRRKIGEAHNGSASRTTCPTLPETASLGRPDKSRCDPSRPLRSLSTNTRVLPQIETGLSRKPLARQAPDKGITALAEDDEFEGPRSGGQSQPVKAKAESNRRLRSLLNVPEPTSPMLAMGHRDGLAISNRSDPSSLNDRPPNRRTRNVSGPLQGRSHRQSDASKPKPTGGRSSAGRNPKPLRSRPVSELRLDDFRVNPKVNQGMDYAFSEVVRGRQARQCLPGCTRPDCCGSTFRLFAEAAAFPALNGPRGLWEESQENVEVGEEDRLLRAHLGLRPGMPLPPMTPESRADLLIRARTQQMADRYGKHRHVFARRATPPGFWRTEMPTTQEMDHDREVAAKAERDKVMERYWEALRADGKWKFRDEV